VPQFGPVRPRLSAGPGPEACRRETASPKINDRIIARDGLWAAG
jgi:hypothetical protein